MKEQEDLSLPEYQKRAGNPVYADKFNHAFLWICACAVGYLGLLSLLP